MSRWPVWTMGASTMLCLAACGGGQADMSAEPKTAPLPTAGIAGQEVTVYPLTLVVAEEELAWSEHLQPRREALDRADSLIATFLTERAPEVDWVLPEQLRRAAGRAPGMLADPDQIGTALLRTLTGMAGGRHALIPASLVFFSDEGNLGRADLTFAIVDVRTARVQWRTVATGKGEEPWTATWNALKSLIPGLP